MRAVFIIAYLVLLHGCSITRQPAPPVVTEVEDLAEPIAESDTVVAQMAFSNHIYTEPNLESALDRPLAAGAEVLATGWTLGYFEGGVLECRCRGSRRDY